jgi:epsin
MIYKRFTEKSAEEWRQIYKALVLLEYLVKHGSERVVDYARSHSAVIDMLKHFHYIDQNGKDQGVNIRNRAKELVTLLSDVELIRTERKKARTNKAKIAGIGNDAGFGGTGKKYGGFGSDSLEFGGGGYSTRKVYGDGGGFDGSNYAGPGYSNDDDFEEYQVGEPSVSSSSRPPDAPKPVKKDEAPIANFISFDDDDDAPAAGSSTQAAEDDDDFDDFQSAAPQAAGATATVPASSGGLNLNDLFAGAATPSSSTTTSIPAMNTFSSPTSVKSPPVATFPQQFSTPSPFVGSTSQPPVSKPPAAKEDAFASLWSSNVSKPKKQNKSGTTSLASLAQERKESTMWGAAASSSSATTSAPNTTNGSSHVDDLLSF